MEFGLRPMEKGDIAQILAIENVSFPTPWAEYAFLSELKNKFAVYYVAVHEDQVVGYAGMWLFSGEAHITTIGVHPDWRGQGLGKMFMDKMINQARDRGASTMILEVRPSNAAARYLYKKMGFRQIGCRKNYYLETREDALVMLLHILPEDCTSRVHKSKW
ncbi:MAG: ribosomal protein S18-alanine N-acetyltransferase [Thermacetogeniaceae bacterium]